MKQKCVIGAGFEPAIGAINDSTLRYCLRMPLFRHPIKMPPLRLGKDLDYWFNLVCADLRQIAKSC